MVLLVGLAAAFASCNDSDNGTGDNWFLTPETEVSGTQVTLLCRTKFAESVLASADAGFVYAVTGEQGPGAFVKAPGVTVDGSTLSCELTGLDAETSYVAYAYVEMGTGGRMQSSPVAFKTGAGPVLSDDPTFGQPGYSEVTASSATVSGSFAYEGGKTISEAYFIYAPSTGGDLRQAVTTAPGQKSAQLSGLTASTAYTFRLCVVIDGKMYGSKVGTFTTAAEGSQEPTFGQMGYSEVTASSATVSGSFAYEGAKTVSEVYFLYASSAGGEQRQAVTTAPGQKSARLSGLAASTAYTFSLRVVIDGKTYGSDAGTFTTSAGGGQGGKTKYTGWAELPVEVDNSDYHYAYHICPDFNVNGHAARNFTVCYSAEHHSPVWVAAPVHSCYVGGSGNRNYGPDPVIPGNIQPSGSGASMGSPYNRGHMLGNHERSRTSGMNKQVSYYTNIAAQHGSTFNTGGGAWNNLEDKIDDYWCADTLYVVVGAYYDKWTDSYGNSASQRTTSFGNKTTSVPTMFYTLCLRTKRGNTNKSVLNCSRDELQCAAFVMSHAMEKGHKPQAKDMRSVKEIEELTGFTFFENVPNAPKDTFNASDWQL